MHVRRRRGRRRWRRRRRWWRWRRRRRPGWRWRSGRRRWRRGRAANHDLTVHDVPGRSASVWEGPSRRKRVPVGLVLVKVAGVELRRRRGGGMDVGILVRPADGGSDGDRGRCRIESEALDVDQRVAGLTGTYLGFRLGTDGDRRATQAQRRQNQQSFHRSGLRGFLVSSLRGEGGTSDRAPNLRS
jgi:hypothetical protein